MQRRLIEAQSGGTVELGGIVMENRAPRRRIGMVHATIPLLAEDGFRLGDPVSVYNTGTGQVERAQVERWGLPWPNGTESCVRLAYRALLASGNLRQLHTVRKTAEGVLPSGISPNVADAIAALRIEFFCGPKTTHVLPIDLLGPSEEVVTGPCSSVRRYIQRIYNATVQTGWGVEIDLETFTDSDYFKLWFRPFWGDPRIDANSENRTLLADADREIGLWIYATGASACEPLPFWPYANERRRFYDAPNGRWEFVWDARTDCINQPAQQANGRQPWGSQGQAEIVMLCGAGGSLDGGGIRDETLQSFRDFRDDTPGVSDQWRVKPKAWQYFDAFVDLPKPIQHWERNNGRTWDYVRSRLEIEVDNVMGGLSNREHAWTIRNGRQGAMQWATYASTGGDQVVFEDFIGGIPILYLVPGFGRVFNRGLQTLPQPFFFREQDGRPVRAADHPDLYYAIGGPSVTESIDKLGHSQGYNAEFSGNEMREEVSGEQITAPKGTHNEICTLPQAILLFGNRGLKRVGEQMYQHHMGSHPKMETRRGRTSSDRAWGRSMKMAAWWTRTVGQTDPYAIDYLTEHVYRHYLKAAHDYYESLNPGRQVRTIYATTDQGTGGLADNGAGNLPYWNPWMNGLHVVGARMLERLLRGRGAAAEEAADFFKWHMDAYEQDVARHAMALKADEVTGLVTWRQAFPAGKSYEATWGMSYQDGQPITLVQWADNQWHREVNVCGGNNYPCTHQGYVIFSSFARGWLDILAFDLFWGDQSDKPWMQRWSQSFQFDDWDTTDPRSTIYGHWIWLRRQFKSAVGVNGVRFVNTHRQTDRASIADMNVVAMAASRLSPGSLWLASRPGASIRRVLLSSGAVQQTAAIPVVPVDGWRDVCPMTVNGQHLLALLDGAARTPGVPHRIVLVAEASPTVVMADLPFLFPFAREVDLDWLAWDPVAGRWLIGEPNGPGIGGLIWSLAPGASTLQVYRGMSIDTDTPNTFAIDADGKLGVMIDGVTGALDIFSRGKEWGVPRLRTTPTGSHWLCCFSHHARDDAAQRIYLFNGARLSELEV